MLLFLPVVFLVVQGLVFWLLPALAVKASYVFMVAAPVLAGVATLWRGTKERSAARVGWFALALALATWALGAFGNLWQEMVLGRLDEMYRDSILAFNLAVVPVTFLLASDWNGAGRRLAPVIDAVLALTLGYAYFIFTWSLLTARGVPDEAGVRTMLWLMDAQNGVVAAGALIRWAAAADAKERELFRALAAYTVGYLVVAFVNNHFIAANPDFGPQTSSIVTAVFALVAGFALLTPAPEPARRRSGRFVRAVHSASPLFLAGTLLIVALFLIRVDYPLGAAAILIAVLGYGLRSTATQVRHIEREDRLQAIAWTDALTGVANRRFFDQALTGAWRRSLRATSSLSVLMIDIDHFKLLNDRYGHPAGDACLREVAHALRQALVRPGDVLARYGGEEFIALLQEADMAGALVVAERLRAAVQALAIENLGSPLGVVTVSVGSASASVVLTTDNLATSLVDAADKALYEAKCAGRNQVRARAVTG